MVYGAPMIAKNVMYNTEMSFFCYYFCYYLVPSERFDRLSTIFVAFIQAKKNF